MNAGTLHAVILKYCTQKGLHYALCKECGGIGDAPVAIVHKEDCAVLALLSSANKTDGNFLIGVENLVSDALLKKALEELSPEKLTALLEFSEQFIMARPGSRDSLHAWCGESVPLLDRCGEVRREDAMAFVRDVCLLRRLRLRLGEFVCGTLERAIYSRYQLGPLMPESL